MITKRVFIEVIRDRLAGGPTAVDEKDKYPIQLVECFVDMALPMVLANGNLAVSEMSVQKTFTPASDANGYYITLNPPACAGVIAINTAEDDNGQFFVMDKSMSNAFKVLRTTGSNKNSAILYGNVLRFNRTTSGNVVVEYVPLVSRMEDNDQLIIPTDENGMNEVSFYEVIVRAILASDRWLNDKTNDDALNPN